MNLTLAVFVVPSPIFNQHSIGISFSPTHVLDCELGSHFPTSYPNLSNRRWCRWAMWWCCWWFGVAEFYVRLFLLFCHIFTLQHDGAHDDFCCDVTLIYVRIVLDLIMFLKGEKDKKWGKKWKNSQWRLNHKLEMFSFFLLRLKNSE